MGNGVWVGEMAKEDSVPDLGIDRLGVKAGRLGSGEDCTAVVGKAMRDELGEQRAELVGWIVEEEVSSGGRIARPGRREVLFWDFGHGLVLQSCRSW